jgi:hypothetical protein
MSPMEWFRDESLTASSWIACAVFDAERAAPPGGYSVVFPTSTDCLLWLRWHVLPLGSQPDPIRVAAPHTITLTAEASSVAGKIDQAPDGAQASDLLTDIESAVSGPWGGLEIVKISSIHDFLSAEGTEEEWQEALESHEVVLRDDGSWEMPQAVWDTLWEKLDEHGECGHII